MPVTRWPRRSKQPYNTLRFEREVHMSVELVSQFEYDTEWFPDKV